MRAAASSTVKPASVSARSAVTPAAIATPSSWASLAPRSCTGSPDATTPSTPCVRARVAISTRSPDSGSAPKLVPGCRSTPVLSASATSACAAAADEPDRTTGARSRSTPCSARGRSSTTRPAPSSTHSDVAPLSRSISRASLAAAASGPLMWTRMSQSVARVGRPDVARPSRSAAAPIGATAMPSSVVRVSLAHTAESGSSSVSLRLLRRTAAAAASQAAASYASSGDASRSEPCSGSSSSGSVRPPGTTVMLGRIGRQRPGVPG